MAANSTDSLSVSLNDERRRASAIQRGKNKKRGHHDSRDQWRQRKNKKKNEKGWDNTHLPPPLPTTTPPNPTQDVAENASRVHPRHRRVLKLVLTGVTRRPEAAREADKHDQHWNPM